MIAVIERLVQMDIDFRQALLDWFVSSSWAQASSYLVLIFLIVLIGTAVGSESKGQNRRNKPPKGR